LYAAHISVLAPHHLLLFHVIVVLLFVSFQADASRESGDGRKSRVNRKYVIIGVTCAVVVAMVIVGVLVGVKFHLNSTNDIVKVYTADTLQ